MDKNTIISNISCTIGEIESIKTGLACQKGIGTEFCSSKLDDVISKLKSLRNTLYGI